MNFTRSKAPANQLSNVLNEVFRTNFGELINTDHSARRPSVNIFEDENAFGIELAAPGLKKEDFTIKVEKDQLIISASNEETHDTGKNKKYRRKEFNFTSFKRSFHLSDEINSEKIEAKYENGILYLTLDKKEEAKEKEPRTISIS